MAYKAKRARRDGGKPRTFRGKKIEDYTGPPVNFVVTQGECKRGKPNSLDKCAAALALKRSRPGAIAAYVGREKTFVEYPTKAIRHRTAHALRDQTVRYDASKKFDAGAYQLLRVPPSQIKSRGKAHTPPDRAHGAADSPKARKALALRHHVGRKSFHFNNENSDFR